MADSLEQATKAYLELNEEIVYRLITILKKHGIRPTTEDIRLRKKLIQCRADLDLAIAAALTQQEIDRQDDIELATEIVSKLFPNR